MLLRRGLWGICINTHGIYLQVAADRTRFFKWSVFLLCWQNKFGALVQRLCVDINVWLRAGKRFHNKRCEPEWKKTNCRQYQTMQKWKFSKSKLTRDCLVWVYHTYHQTHCTNHLCVGRSTHAGILRGQNTSPSNINHTPHHTILYYTTLSYTTPHHNAPYHIIPNFINRKDFSLILGVSWPTFSRYVRMNMLGAKLTIFCSPQPYGIFNKFSIPPIDEPRISPWKNKHWSMLWDSSTAVVTCG